MPDEPSINPILSLPCDVLEHVFRFVNGNTTDLASARMACKAFRSMANNVTQAVYINNMVSSDAILTYSKLVAEIPGLKELHVQMCRFGNVYDWISFSEPMQQHVLAVARFEHMNTGLHPQFFMLKPMCNLTLLTINKSHDVTDLSCLPRSLIKLRVNDCASLSTLNLDSCKESLTSLRMTKCPKLNVHHVFSECSALTNMQTLRLIDLSPHDQLTDDADRRFQYDLPGSLKRLHVHTNFYWDVRNALKQVRSLNKLILRVSDSIYLPPVMNEFEPEWDITDMIKDMQHLRVLSLYGYYVLPTKIPTGLSHFRKARVLDMGSSLCSTNMRIDNLWKLRKLHVSLGFGDMNMDVENDHPCDLDELTFRCINKLSIFPSPDTFCNLRTLEMINCEDIADAMPMVNGSMALTRLKIDTCSIDRLAVPVNVKDLILYNNSGLTVIDFTESTGLENVDIQCCTRLNDIMTLRHCTSIKTLHLESCFYVGSLSFLSALCDLERCTLAHLPNAKLLPGCLARQRQLQHVKIVSLGVDTLWFIGGNQSVSSIQICSSIQVIDVGAIVKCPNVQELRIKCRNAINVCALGYVHNLRILSLTAFDLSQDMIRYLKMKLPETFMYVVNLSDTID